MKLEVDTEMQTVAVAGVRIALPLLAEMGSPDADVLYRMRKDDRGVVTVQQLRLQPGHASQRCSCAVCLQLREWRDGWP